MINPKCYGTTQYSEVSHICINCHCYQECGVLSKAIRNRFNPGVADREECRRFKQ